MLVHQKLRQLRLGVVAGELEKIGTGGHLRVVSGTRVRYAKGLNGLQTDRKHHKV